MGFINCNFIQNLGMRSLCFSLGVIQVMLVYAPEQELGVVFTGILRRLD